jgi:hypothetical protein
VPQHVGQGATLRTIVRILSENDKILVDEFFFQCIKQTVNNRTKVISCGRWSSCSSLRRSSRRRTRISCGSGRRSLPA